MSPKVGISVKVKSEYLSEFIIIIFLFIPAFPTKENGSLQIPQDSMMVVCLRFGTVNSICAQRYSGVAPPLMQRKISLPNVVFFIPCKQKNERDIRDLTVMIFIIIINIVLVIIIIEHGLEDKYTYTDKLCMKIVLC